MAELAYHRPAILGEVDYDRHAVIEASAGTGKTYVIERLFADLVLSGRCDFEQVLAVTFTEKATGELRARLRATLEAILRGEETKPRAGHEQVGLDATGCDRLYAALNSFERAPVFTIHGFCQRVLVDFAFLTGTSFAPEVVDARGAFHRAFRAEMRDRLAIDEATHGLLSAWLDPDGGSGNLDALESLLFEAHRRRYLDREPAARRDDAARLLADFNQSILKDAYRQAAIRNADRALALESVGKLDELIRGCKGSPEELLGRLGEVDLKTLVRPHKANPGKNTRRFPGGLARDAQQQIQLLGTIHIAALGRNSTEGRLLENCLSAIEERLGRDKRDTGQIDFDDMLSLVWRAIDGPRGGSLVAALRSRYRYALLDEFQDTDDLQWQIFKRLFVHDSPGNLLYVVGDPKQAIYAFRGADVFTYLEARDELVAAGASRIPLAQNFRSTRDMIDALNHVLDQSAQSPLFNGEIRYDHPVECGKPELTARAGDEALVPISLLRFQPAVKANAPVIRDALGRHVAAALRRILFEPAHRIEIASGDGTPRNVEARDVFVLTRTGRQSEEIGAYLREAGVPFAFYKKEGLFQTGEALAILDVLRAVESPGDRSRRLKAWSTPFFGVAFADLAAPAYSLPEHPLVERLYRWNALGERERFTDLFASLLHESGLVEREMFLSDSERELTNYLHIFEVLLEQSRARALSLSEVVALLNDYVAKKSDPPGTNGNVERLESERQAVQVMTVHMSKGLEADVVVLYGGMYDGTKSDTLAVFHRDRRLRFALGEQRNQASVKDLLKREKTEENQRLLYVAMTRARAKLYLPFIPNDCVARGMDGYYGALNERLGEIVSAVGKAAATDPLRTLFCIEEIDRGNRAATATRASDRQLESWSPPPGLLDDSGDSKARDSFLKIAARHEPLRIASYTSLHARTGPGASDIPVEEFKGDIATGDEGTDLPGGRNVGIFLHEVIERLDMNSFRESGDFDSWRTRDDVRALFLEGMMRHQVRDPRWRERGLEVIYNTLASSVELADGDTEGPLWSLRHVREMEFICPIPETGHPTLASVMSGGNWKVERGYLKGFVDFLFENRKMVYFADWKSDLLASYDAETIEKHVKENYQLQARIYCVGVLRLLRIRGESDYRERFGGLLYVFLRGTRAAGTGREGVYFHRPAWDEILSYEQDLMRIVEAAGHR